MTHIAVLLFGLIAGYLLGARNHRRPQIDQEIDDLRREWESRTEDLTKY